MTDLLFESPQWSLEHGGRLLANHTLLCSDSLPKLIEDGANFNLDPCQFNRSLFGSNTLLMKWSLYIACQLRQALQFLDEILPSLAKRRDTIKQQHVLAA